MKQCFYIETSILTDSDSFQDVVVKIERPTYQKPFLGGFKNKITGVEFHNAGSQTTPKKRLDKGIQLFCRETQVMALWLLFEMLFLPNEIEC